MAAQERIGFDRELRLEWLDAVAAQAARGADADSARKWLDRYLADTVRGDKHGGPRDKTIVKLCRIWISPPDAWRPLRDHALTLLPETDGLQRLALHWGMAMVAYPFFGSVADAVGRLLSLQDDVERVAVVRRMYETWGERPFVNRATRAVWNSLILWGVLVKANNKGKSVRAPKQIRLDRDPELFLIESTLAWIGKRSLPLSTVASLPFMFPFDMSDASSTARLSKRVHICRQGSELDIVTQNSS